MSHQLDTQNRPLQSQLVPKGYVRQIFEQEWKVECDEQRMWNWLNSVSTFRDHQSLPYVVEFLDPDSPSDPQFRVGVDTNHYGPFLNAAGVITQIDPMKYRDLQYYYGSFVFSFRLVRPVRLEFFYDSEKKVLKMKMTNYVRSFFASLWSTMLSWFWPRFGTWMNKQNQSRS